MNNSLVGAEVKAGTEAKAGIRAKTWLGPGVRLRDEAEEVLPEWEPPTGPGSLASSSSIRLVQGGFDEGNDEGNNEGGSF